MAIYIAVYDVHPGYRKHFERLLNREGDERKASGEVLYIDSYGSVEALLSTPMKYDLFIIDAVDSVLYPTGSINDEIADKIRHIGSEAPIALFFPEEVTGPVSTSRTHCRCFKKPVAKEIISDIVEWAHLRKEQRVPRLELRGDKNTFYVTPDEILYATSQNICVDVVLTEDRTVHLHCDLVELSVMTDDYKCFLEIGRDALINMNAVTDFDGHTISMTDGTTIPVSFFDSSKISEQLEAFKNK